MGARATTADEPPQGGQVVEFDTALWRQLLAQGDREAFYESWLALQARQLPGVIGGVLIALDEEGVLRPAAHWPKGSLGGLELMKAVESAATRRTGVVRRNGPEGGEGRVTSFAYPVTVDDEVVAVAGFNVGSAERDLQAALRRVQWGSVWIENSFRERKLQSANDLTGRLSAALDLVAVTVEHASYGAAAIALATETATRLNLERASIGFVRGAACRVAAISHTSEVSRRQNLVRGIAAAMDEAVDQGMIVVYPPARSDNTVVVAHRALSQRLGAGGQVITIPLGDDNGVFGAITLEYPVERHIDERDVETAHTLGLLAGQVLRVRRREDRLLIVKAADTARAHLARLLGAGYLGRKLFVGAVAAAAVFFAFYTSRFTVPARAVIEGSVQRVVAAPFDGYIAEEHARPGDVVHKGQLLARLDERELQLELATWRSRREQYEAERQSALAERDVARSQVLDGQIAEAESQIDLVQRKIDLGRITAPFDGLILSGDLSQMLGGGVRLGDPLFQLAPLTSYRLVLQVDEEDIHEVGPGQTGGLILAARPDQVLDFEVTRITSVTQPFEGSNFFRVEGQLREAPDNLRPGMQGVAKIAAGERLLVWIWTRRAVNWARVQLWKWLP